MPNNDITMKIYLVGGAVRDQLLNLPSKDKDWLVVGSTPEHMIAQGFEQVGADFPVFLHPTTKEEYALARTERKTHAGHLGFSCFFSPDVTLEEDLMRRDLTINAMAQDDNGNIIDPYGGQNDLRNKILRHVSPAFSEDPLRVLRVARFAARFAPLGFTLAPETLSLMRNMVKEGELEHLVAERVWQETHRALLENTPSRYFEILKECGALAVWFPELDALFGVPQPETYHPEIDCGIHALLSLTAAHHAQRTLCVRWASLVHDLGKGATPKFQWPRHLQHEKRGLPLVKRLNQRLKVPTECAETALLACEFHTHIHRVFELKPRTLLTLFNTLDVWRRPQRLENLLEVAQADSQGRTGFEDREYPQADYCRQAFAIVQQVTAQDMMAQGHQGAAIKAALEQARLETLTQWVNQQRPQHSPNK